MAYEKPRRSAGLIIGGLFCLAITIPLVLLAPAFAWIPGVAAAALIITGLWRFFDAFDNAALDHWTRTCAEEERVLQDKAAERAARTKAGGE